MREIKFRYWNAIHQEFIQDCDVYLCPDGEILVGDLDNPPIIRVGDSVIPSQYTGLKDKNGVEIYEGDILEYPDLSKGVYLFKEQPKRLGVINWNDRDAGFKLPGTGFQINTDRVEVIGNIYENPELLKTE